MTLNSKSLLNVFGYEIDSRGNISYGTNQIAIVSLENEGGGGILRVHGSDDQFFYTGDIMLGEKNLLFPSKITAKYVYFRGASDAVRVEANEFVDSTIKAFIEFDKLSSKRLAG
jgi:hypothetical protein